MHKHAVRPCCDERESRAGDCMRVGARSGRAHLATPCCSLRLSPSRSWRGCEAPSPISTAAVVAWHEPLGSDDRVRVRVRACGFLRETYRTERRAALHQSFNVGEDDLADARAQVQPLPKPVTQSTASCVRGSSSAPLVTSEVVRTAPTRRNGAGADARHRRRGHVVE